MNRWISGVAGVALASSLFGQAVRANEPSSHVESTDETAAAPAEEHAAEPPVDPNVALRQRIQEAIEGAKEAGLDDTANNLVRWLELLDKGEVTPDELAALKSQLDELPKPTKTTEQAAEAKTPAEQTELLEEAAPQASSQETANSDTTDHGAAPVASNSPDADTAHRELGSPQSNATGEEFTMTQMHAAIDSTRKDDPELADLMEHELSAMQAEGELKPAPSSSAVLGAAQAAGEGIETSMEKVGASLTGGAQTGEHPTLTVGVDDHERHDAQP